MPRLLRILKLPPRVERSACSASARLATGLLLVLAAGCAPRRPAPDPVDPAADRRIEDELRSRIAAEPSLHPDRIRSEVRGSRVRLYGSVEGIGAWYCALRNAWLVEGVEGVSDFLLIERGPREVSCVAERR